VATPRNARASPASKTASATEHDDDHHEIFRQKFNTNAHCGDNANGEHYVFNAMSNSPVPWAGAARLPVDSLTLRLIRSDVRSHTF